MMRPSGRQYLFDIVMVDGESAVKFKSAARTKTINIRRIAPSRAKALYKSSPIDRTMLKSVQKNVLTAKICRCTTMIDE